MARFLDTNVLMRYFTDDDPVKARSALTLIERVERGEERVVITPPVIFEVIFLLERSYKIPKARVRDMVREVLALRDLQLAEKTICRRALDLFVQENISYPDAYNAIWMQQKGVTEVYSWDREFDRVSALVRVEP
jgi:predicted nucleic acid-binding protein